MIHERDDSNNILLEKVIASSGDNIIRVLCTLVNKKEYLLFYRLSLSDGSSADFMKYEDAFASLAAHENQ